MRPKITFNWLNDKLPIISFLIGIVLIFRLIESLGVLQHFYYEYWFVVLLEELIGLISDIGFIVLYFSLASGIEKILNLKKYRLRYLHLLFFSILTCIHTALLFYYLSQRAPLGEMLFKHTWDEISFTIQSTGTSIFQGVVVILVLITLIFICYRFWSNKIYHSTTNSNFVLATFLISLVVFIIALFFQGSDHFWTNKSTYFYKQSYHYFMDEDPLENLNYSKEQVMEFQQLFPKKYTNTHYPLLHLPDTTNYLASYFNEFTEKPNLVLIIVEGLSDEFIHQNNGVALMPFLHSLKDSSLYWERCFTLGERSFAAVPSTLGGLPYGKNSFAQLETYPTFLSLISILNRNGYQTSDNEAQGAWFLSKDQFFNSQHIDYIFDKQRYPKEAQKIIVNDYFWGYDDKSLFEYSLQFKDNYPKTPFLDVYFTGSMHSPFVIRNQKEYEKRYQRLLNHCTNNSYRKQLETFQENYITTLFTDDALKNFFEAYRKRSSYKNTIFIITGDHPMTETPRTNLLKRYHVPLIVYSPMLKQQARSKNVVSHLDLYQTVLNLLRKYGVESPNLSASLGEPLRIKGANKNRSIVFMDGNRNIEEIYHNSFYFNRGSCYRVDDDWSIEEINHPSTKSDLSKRLQSFKYVNLLSTYKNRLFPMKNFLDFFNLEQIHHYINHKQRINNEMYHQLDSTQLQTAGTYFIDTKIDCKNLSPNTSLVVQATTRDNQSVFWKNYGLVNNLYQLEFRDTIHIDSLQTQSKLNFYIWNKDQEKLLIKKFETTVTRLKMD